MLGFKRRKADIISHWYAIVPSFQTSAQDFYSSIERELAAQKIPGMEMTRVDFAEGGALSDKRTYLRMLRERLVFDICAAPFGVNYFFSGRFAEIPLKVAPWQIIVGLLILLTLTGLSIRYIGWVVGPLFLLGLVGLTAWAGRNAVSLGLQDLDAAIIKIPALGALYERFIRAETYYRQDTRLLYVDLVSNIVKKQVEAVSAANGVKVVRFNEYDPVLAELYKPRVVRPGTDKEAAPPAPNA